MKKIEDMISLLVLTEFTNVTDNMYINAQKSKIMVVSRQDNISVQVDHEGESLEQVHDFNFLGSYKSADEDCTKEIKRRIVLLNRIGPGKS